MLPGVRLVRAPLALIAAVALAAGCGDGGGRDSPPADEVAQTVADLERALRDRDLEGVCERILSPDARRRAGGEECPRRLARTTRGVEAPTIELVNVTLGRGSATARVRARAGDERPALDSISLVRGPDGYRVDRLSADD